MIQSPSAAASSSSYQFIFDSALEVYRKKTKNDLASHPLLTRLELCDSPEAVLTTLRRDIFVFDQAWNSNDKSTRWLSSTVKVLHVFSSIISEGVGLVSLSGLVQGRHLDAYYRRHIHPRW
jgi:hypothetical protein